MKFKFTQPKCPECRDGDIYGFWLDSETRKRVRHVDCCGIVKFDDMPGDEWPLPDFYACRNCQWTTSESSKESAGSPWILLQELVKNRGGGAKRPVSSDS